LTQINQAYYQRIFTKTFAITMHKMLRIKNEKNISFKMLNLVRMVLFVQD